MLSKSLALLSLTIDFSRIRIVHIIFFNAHAAEPAFHFQEGSDINGFVLSYHAAAPFSGAE